ncbi:Lipase 1 precursor [Streptomyces sp. YIM 130001]|uniref:golvesin C-terminal-like domain-containing protein n=1 Tax=Streptomyces sp. YIM 130001 TaxID=2259644 RepID=UPI000EE86BB3|nr:GDSL-type esterase/lipase family protein [Streptomyces sp. YIM 130001]RII06988.1 Lipase 1 precursor [Streptomyces sp. YIM 130001]
MTAIVAGALLGSLVQATAWADDAVGRSPSVHKADKKELAEVPAGERSALLGSDYKASRDLAWATTSDARGFHLLTASQKNGYTWRTAASLSEPGFDADAWIGNACVTGSGERAVVVYAPRTFTNKPDLMARGAFTAIVELSSGKVTKLPLRASLSYYNPGCGVGEDTVLTQSGGEDKAATRLVRVDAATGKLSKPVETKGQVTSTVVTKDGTTIGAAGAQIVKVDAGGNKTTLATTDAVPYRLAPDADGGVVFLDKKPAPGKGASARERKTARQTQAKRLTARQITAPDAEKTRPALLAEGPLAETGLTRNADTVYVTGKAAPVTRALPKTVQMLPKTPKGARVSTLGEAVLTETAWTDGQGALINAKDADLARPVNIDMTVRSSGKKTAFTVDPTRRPSNNISQSRDRTPALAAPKSSSGTPPNSRPGARAAGRNEIVESERVCSVPRNDPRNQAIQPKPRQVEWAVNQAIIGGLNKHISRSANWKNLGMPAYQPQTLFPRPSLEGGGRIPAQVMLGITTQESNMWQAARSAVPGVTGNPLIGNYYGIDYYDGEPSNDWDIDWAEADCGYGISQVTDHMRMAGREDGHGGAAWPYDKQRAVALDYTANLAAGLQILSSKWNETRKAGLQINDGNPNRLENWTFALWAYNSGFYANKGDGSPWGVGWANNPANPEWDASRTPFMEDALGNERPSDAAHPQDWPYQEKVIGFAAHPPSFLEAPGKLVPAFRAAWWNGTGGDATADGSAKQNRAKAKPPEDTFCTAGNGCDPGKISDGAENEPGAGPCTRSDFTCWWHLPAEWKDDCDYSCGNEFVRFDDSYPEEADGTAYPPQCTTTGLPSNALIIDDLPGGTPPVRAGCNNSWANKGTFTVDFGDGETGGHPSQGTRWPSKVDLHQLGAGFGGHFYFGHSRQNDAKGQRLNFTATWKLSTARTDWMRVMVHLPDHGAHTQQAKYEIDTGSGSFTETRYINQKRQANNWVNLGTYKMDGTPRVRLATQTDDGTGDDDVAFDAVAFQPLPKKPQHMVAVLGDSYTSGEGAGSYLKETDDDFGNDRWNACRRSKNSWARKTTLPGQSATLGELADAHSASVDYQDVSCSGARTWQMSGGPKEWGYDGNFREMTQVDSGVLTDATTLVTLTAGGNDAKFADVIRMCATTGCPSDDDVRGDIDSIISDIEDVLRAVNFEASNAKIVLMGYPELFNADAVTCVSGVGGGGMSRINAHARYLETKQKDLVATLKGDGLPVTFESPNADFEGKRACDDQEGVNKIVKAPAGDGDFRCEPGGSWCVSRESYHPNNAGTSAYAAAFRRAVGKL